MSDEDRNSDRSDRAALVGSESALVQDVVSRQASCFPQAVAIKAGCKSLTYLELEARQPPSAAFAISGGWA